MTLRWARFSELDVHSLYALLRLRAEVFVVEQHCVFADPDGQDAEAWHLLAEDAQGLTGCARLFLPGVAKGGAQSSMRGRDSASLGRIVTAPRVRGSGLGRELVLAAQSFLLEQAGPIPLRIGAQSRLEPFYRQLGFEADGSPFLEDGILHRPMVYRPGRTKKA